MNKVSQGNHERPILLWVFPGLPMYEALNDQQNNHVQQVSSCTDWFDKQRVKKNNNNKNPTSSTGFKRNYLASVTKNKVVKIFSRKFTKSTQMNTKTTILSCVTYALENSRV